MSTLFTMTVDTEEEWAWGEEWPTGDLSCRNIEKLPAFQDLCATHGVHTTYFVAWSVMNDPGARDIILDLAQRPHVEIGMHIHPWNTPPLEESTEVSSERTFLRNYPEETISAKLNTVYQSFREHNIRPVTFRGGRYSSGGAIHEFLQANEFLADVSAVPFTTWDEPGAPDYRHRDLTPHRHPPAPEGTAPLWDIPLTMAFTQRAHRFWGRAYDLFSRSMLRKFRLIGLLEKIGMVKRIWLNFEIFSAEEMLLLLRRLRPLKLPCLCFTVHSSSLMAGGNPYTPSEQAERQLWDSVDQVFSTLAEWSDFQPATVSEVAQHLEREYHARTRN